MRKNEFKKKGSIIDRLLKNSDKIVYGLLGLLGLSALLIQGLFAQVRESLECLYKISLGIQVLLCLAITLFSHYICDKTWGKELSIKKADAPLNKEEQEKENEVMKSCGYNYNEEEWEKAKEIANYALDEFKVFWSLIWVSWLYLYLAYFIKYYSVGKTKIIDFFLNPLSNINTLMLLICYLILYEITIKNKRTGISEKPNWAPWASLLLIITFFEIILQSIPLVTEYESFLKIFGWINGITSGAVMALFVGAFDNEFIKPKFVYTASLYLYMAIQAIFPIYLNYEKDLAMQVLISFTTLVCKIILFLLVAERINSGRLLFYFIRIRKLHYDFDDKWEKFLNETRDCPGKRGRQKCKRGVKLKELKMRLQ